MDDIKNNKIYQRSLKLEIIKYLEEPEAIIIFGSRQVGKSTLLKMIMNEIADPKRTYYLDLEEPRMLDIVEGGPQNLLDYIYQLGAPPDKKCYVFLDEIHYMRYPSKFIKLIVDHYANKIKIICTGSSTLGIRIKFHDALVGRKLVFTLFPLSFKEFLTFKEREDLARALPDEPFEQEKDSSEFFQEEYLRYFYEFMIFGGYPKVVLENNFEKKEKFLGEIVSAYIFKDIRALFNIGDIIKFNNLIKILASRSSSLINVSQLANDVGISRQTVMNYISILENSFLIMMLPPYSRSLRVEVRKAKKIYWLDTGIRNYIIGDLSYSKSRSDVGILLENMIFNSLVKRKKEIEHLFFWRTKDKTEVDFIYQKGNKIIPIEVKQYARAHRGLNNFMKKYKVSKGYIAHMGEFKQGEISFVPIYWF